MLFFTPVFAVFFAIFYPLFLLVRKHVVARNLFLLAAAFIFYGWWDVRFLALLTFTISLDYLCALGAAGRRILPGQLLRSCLFLGAISILGFAANHFRQPLVLLLPPATAILMFLIASALFNSFGNEHKRRRAWLFFSLVLNLSVLAFFKYFNFFGESLTEALQPLGIELGFVALKIILPLGISFHTFQSIGRMVDCYRDRIEPSTDLLEFAAFLSYFPQILAGPIERANHMLPQFRNVMPITRELLGSGSMLFLWGMFKKVVVADNMALIANPIFAAPGGHSSGELAVAALAFSFQIYGDFSGYTDMARGLARLMGFELLLNFNLPYFSRTPTEFWRRWHISLSSWLRDYLYIALGGNRGPRWMVYRNLMLTMLLGGLWHGAAWTFVFWGFIHGSIQIVYRALGLDDRLKAINAQGGARAVTANFVAWAVLMPIIAVTWIYFRADTMAAGNMMVAGILRLDGAHGAWLQFAFYTLPLFIVDGAMRFERGRDAYLNAPFFVRYTAVIALLFSLAVLTSPTGGDFIYFDF
jgi:D-alanyl-lipoteichoic acid acyltransferase DltB (MBOAT superfamily)